MDIFANGMSFTECSSKMENIKWKKRTKWDDINITLSIHVWHFHGYGNQSLTKHPLIKFSIFLILSNYR